MALNPLYFVTSDLESYFVDKDTGLPLANGIIYFYRDSARTVPKEVFQLTGAPPNYTYTSMGAQINLSSVGTVQNSGGDNEVIYYYPFDVNGNIDLYYIVVQDSAGTVQLTREAWPNSAGNGSGTPSENNQLTNQISNPTFTNVFINQGMANVYSVTAANFQDFKFAPDWRFQISGTGTVTIIQIPIEGSSNVPGNPPYMLDIQISSGITYCALIQDFFNNSGLWSSTSASVVYLYGSIVGKNMNSGFAPVQMIYAGSGGGNVNILTASLSASYIQQSGSTVNAINPSADSQSGVLGGIFIILLFSANTHVQLSCVEVIPIFDAPVVQFPLNLDSSDRIEAYQGDYYIPRASAKQIDSFLVGWDFVVNPYQFGSSGSITTTSGYIIDQTIAASATSNVSWLSDPISGGLQLTTTGTNDSFYLLQYLSGDNISDLVTTSLSSNIFGYQSDLLTSNNITMKVQLFRAPSTSSIPTSSTGASIGTINAAGTFTLTAAGWTEIPRGGLSTAQATLSKIANNTNIINGNNDYKFSQWQITNSAQIGDTNLFAIVVIFTYVRPSTIFTINSISLVPGELPCRPAVKSLRSTLVDCKYYYDSSFLAGVTPANGAGQTNCTYGSQSPASAGPFNARFPAVKYSFPMRTNPRLTLYNPITAITPTSSVHDLTANIDWSSAVPVAPSVNGFTIGGATTGSTGNLLLVSWTADARLGVIT